MEKTCIDCKHEPGWSEWYGSEHPRCSGICKFKFKMPKLPPTIKIHYGAITRYKEDDSCVPFPCKVWENK